MLGMRVLHTRQPGREVATMLRGQAPMRLPHALIAQAVLLRRGVQQSPAIGPRGSMELDAKAAEMAWEGAAPRRRVGCDFDAA